MSAPAEITKLSERIQLPADAEAFCRKHGLERYLEIAVAIAEECFDPLQLNFEKSQDPEFEDHWITMVIDVHGTVDSLLAANRKYTSQMVARVPAPECFMIRHSINVL